MDLLKYDLWRIGQSLHAWAEVLFSVAIALTPILLVAALVKYVFFN